MLANCSGLERYIDELCKAPWRHFYTAAACTGTMRVLVYKLLSSTLFNMALGLAVAYVRVMVRRSVRDRVRFKNKT